MSSARLHPDDLDALADALAARLLPLLTSMDPGPGSRMVDAAGLADALGLSRAYVYEHADQLGAIRTGTGPRARLRFDVSDARDRLTALTTPAVSSSEVRPKASPPRGNARPHVGSVLRVRGPERSGS